MKYSCAVWLLGWKTLVELATFWPMYAYGSEQVEDTARLKALVEEKTGYGVTVGTVNTDKADAEMNSAAQAHPAHMIDATINFIARMAEIRGRA